jgi:hypothetical protein
MIFEFKDGMKSRQWTMGGYPTFSEVSLTLAESLDINQDKVGLPKVKLTSMQRSSTFDKRK